MKAFSIKRNGRILTALGFMLAFSAVAQAQKQTALSEQSLRNEGLYVMALNNLGMSEYAELVMRDLYVKYPEHKASFDKIMIEIVLQQGKFDEAKKIIAEKQSKEPDSLGVWTMRLTMDDYYFAHGNYPMSTNSYNALIVKYSKAQPPEEMKAFYANAVYKLAQMQLRLRLSKEATATYKILLDFLKENRDLNREMRRQATFEYAELQFRTLQPMKAGKPRDEQYKIARKATEDVLWEQDLWFGRAVVLLAQLELADGKMENAEKLIQQYMTQLRNIDNMLKEMSTEDEDLTRYTPIAECRYLLGMIALEKTEKLVKEQSRDLNKIKALLGEALNEFVNVYARYASSSWAADAMNRADEVVALLMEEYGAQEIRIPLTPAQRREIADKQFDNARMLFHQSLFDEAITAYLTVLNQFPESIPQSLDGLSELVRAFAQLGDDATDRKSTRLNSSH